MNEEPQTPKKSFCNDSLFDKKFVKTYSPSHITGFFEICDNKNPLYKGSIGCGIVLEAGCVTEVSLCNNLSVKVQIKINGRAEEANTTKYVVEHLAGMSEVEVSTNFEVPVGCGFGASGAGALSTAFALNELLSLDMTVNEVAQIAHCAEVENSTGLGDVIAETYGGVVIRKKPGPPGIGVIDRIPHRNEKISYVALGKKSTKTVLREGGGELKRRINEAGREAMKALMRKPTLETFMRASREFSLRIELISDACKDAIEAVDAEGEVASVAMLGETVFVIGDSEALSEFGEVKESRIADVGANIIGILH
ncbi:MAG: pantoate kinase [Euryarchaeota archaeon]|nr:pantoate kinase [Euryarchaeota archaeon]